MMIFTNESRTSHYLSDAESDLHLSRKSCSLLHTYVARVVDESNVVHGLKYANSKCKACSKCFSKSMIRLFIMPAAINLVVRFGLSLTGGR